MSRPAKSLRALLSQLPFDVAIDRSADIEITGVVLDSRQVIPGSVFLACAGLSSHGLDYVEHAVRAGASAVLWEPSPGATLPEFPADVLAIEVPKLSVHAGRMASAFYGDPSSRLRVVGITGTNGKTSVSHLTAQALSAYGRRCALVGTLGYGFPDSLEPASHTTPDPVRLQALLAQMSGSGAEAIAMEVSSHALEQHRVNGVQFHAAVFTNLTRDHLDYHGDLESYAAAKKRLFEMPGLAAAVVNADDSVGREILAALSAGIQRWAFATHQEALRDIPEGQKIFAHSISFGEHGLELGVTTAESELVIRAPLFGRFNALNLLAVFGVLLSMDVTPAEAVRALAAVRPVRGRMERLGGGERPLVIVDYAHTPDALAQILTAAREHCAGKLICMFGCGGDRDRGKRPEMGRIAESLADEVVVTDDNPRTEDGDAIVAQILAGMTAPLEATVERDRATAIHDAVARAQVGDVVVLAGKGHEDYQIVGAQRMEFSDREAALSALGMVA